MGAERQQSVQGAWKIGNYMDQAGNPVSREQIARMFSESMLANVIAFEEAGVPRQELQQSVGRDGGMVVGRGVVYRVPVAEYLSEEDGELLFNSYSDLIGAYNKGPLDQKRINEVKVRNNVSSKVRQISGSLNKQSK